jgi:hypothetical protein
MNSSRKPELTRRLKLLSELRGRIPDGGLPLLTALENRLGGDALSAMRHFSQGFQVIRAGKLDLADHGDCVGQVAYDEKGDLWAMISSEVNRKHRLLKLKEGGQVVETVNITAETGMFFYMDQSGPWWFDSLSLRFVGPGEEQMLNLSAHAAALGSHVYLKKFLRLGPNEYVGLFFNQDRTSRILLHIQEDTATAFMPDKVKLAYDMAVMNGTILLAELNSAWVYALDLKDFSVRIVLDQPLSFLLNSIVPGQGNRLWTLSNAGQSLAICRGGKVTHFVYDMAELVGEPIKAGYQPACLAVREEETRNVVAVSGLLPRCINWLELRPEEADRAP